MTLRVTTICWPLRNDTTPGEVEVTPRVASTNGASLRGRCEKVVVDGTEIEPIFNDNLINWRAKDDDVDRNFSAEEQQPGNDEKKAAAKL